MPIKNIKQNKEYLIVPYIANAVWLVYSLVEGKILFSIISTVIFLVLFILILDVDEMYDYFISIWRAAK